MFHESEVDERRRSTTTRVRLGDGTALPLRRARRRDRRPAPARGDRGPDRRRLERARLHLLRRPRAPTALREALERFDGGRLVVNIVDMPIKCPVAPLEFAFLADWYLRERGIRDRTELVLRDAARRRASPSRSPRSTSPACSPRRTIELVTEFNAGEVDGVGGKLVSYDGRELAVRPARDGARSTAAPPTSSARRASATRSASSRPTRARCRRRAKPNVFALGDATDLPTSKAGSVTHFEGEVLTENIVRFLAGEELDGRASTATPTASSRPASTRRC